MQLSDNKLAIAKKKAAGSLQLARDIEKAIDTNLQVAAELGRQNHRIRKRNAASLRESRKQLVIVRGYRESGKQFIVANLI